MPNRDDMAWDVVVGNILAAHGLQGWVKVLPLTDSPTRLMELQRVQLTWPNGETAWGIIQEVRAAGRYALVKFAEADDRDDAEALIGATINIHFSMRKPLPEGQYYVDQILGLRVETLDGEHLGTIVEVIETPANDVYSTQVAMIPATPEAIETIDLETGVMRVRRSTALIEKKQ